MSDLSKFIRKIGNEIEDLKLPKWLRTAKVEIVEEVKELSEHVDFGMDGKVLHRAKRTLIRHGGEFIRNAWDAAPWYAQLLKPFVMPPTMRRVRGLLKKI